jgi:hypothetical protein
MTGGTGTVAPKPSAERSSASGGDGCSVPAAAAADSSSIFRAATTDIRSCCFAEALCRMASANICALPNAIATSRPVAMVTSSSVNPRTDDRSQFTVRSSQFAVRSSQFAVRKCNRRSSENRNKSARRSASVRRSKQQLIGRRGTSNAETAQPTLRLVSKPQSRVLSANSPTGCSAEKQPVTGHGLRARRGAPFAATRLGVLKRPLRSFSIGD